MISLVSMREKTASWLRQGISPRRLALTLALGLAIGCIPVLGLPTVLCAVLAFALKLNLPVIQAANYVAMPLQLALIAPFIRMGRWMVWWGPRQTESLHAMMHLSPLGMAWHITGFAGQALMAWFVIAAPTVAALTAILTLVFRRVPAFAAAHQAGKQVS
jgi:uncharacterized protein (DUF2062 family)